MRRSRGLLSFEKPLYGGGPILDLRLMLVGGAIDFQPWMIAILDEGG
jgi:hypothetical protein